MGPAIVAAVICIPSGAYVAYDLWRICRAIWRLRTDEHGAAAVAALTDAKE